MQLTLHVRFGEGETGDPAMGDRSLLDTGVIMEVLVFMLN
jgi:hypothetical protein